MGSATKTTTALAVRESSTPYVAPFIVFLALLTVQNYVPLPQVVEYALRLVIMTAVLWFFSRNVIDFRTRHLAASVGLGIAVFALWVAPDALFPGYRSHWLFQNSLTGSAKGTIQPGIENNFLLLALRTLRASLIVPIVEELFWRAWLMRWLIERDFWKVPLGTYAPQAFWITALLFASEHGPYWEVGLLCGIIYNWWMVKTKSLGDLILAHAVTNACLCAYVILTQKWEYWL
jgi:CAAX prenyl protease-like protein